MIWIIYKAVRWTLIPGCKFETTWFDKLFSVLSSFTGGGHYPRFGPNRNSRDLGWPILKTEKRQNFDEILFTRIKNIVHLRVDHNMIDNKMILLIATHWNHCLKLLEIDCRYAYRNFQFSRGRHFIPGKRTKGFKTFEQSISGLNEFRVRLVRVHCIKWT